MGLAQWDIAVRFERSDDMEPEAAACNADDEYLRATLYFDLEHSDPSDDQGNVIHELAHCLTWELLRVAEHLAGRDRNAKEMVRAASERCTTLIERIPLWRQAVRGS